MKSLPVHAAALLGKVQGDLYVLERLESDPAAPTWVLGFHAQQAVEKALKAVLSFHGITFPHTHNLAMLLELLRRDGRSLPAEGDALLVLIPFGVAQRYEASLDEEIQTWTGLGRWQQCKAHWRGRQRLSSLNKPAAMFDRGD